jgi:hypothetical protein
MESTTEAAREDAVDCAWMDRQEHNKEITIAQGNKNPLFRFMILRFMNLRFMIFVSRSGKESVT